jgi:aminocarboxymuconate-semialdehyde decarboxylase
MMYDAHTHFITLEVLQWIRDNRNTIQAQWTVKDPQKAPFLSINGNWEFELKEAFVEPQLYLEEQAKARIRHSLVSPIPQLFLYEFAPEVTLELARVYNDSLAAWSKLQGIRISGLATVPMNDPAAAAAELERAVKLGLRGAIVGSSWSGRMLSEEAFHGFWEAAHANKAIVFVHPLLCTDPRLGKKMMANLVGVPWETTIAATDLLLSGIPERYPDARILLAHGGGFLPYQIGRLNKGGEKWPVVSSAMQDSPKKAIRRFWFDTVLWNPELLPYLAGIVGEDRIVQGTDYPFDLCEWPPASHGEVGFRTLLG